MNLKFWKKKEPRTFMLPEENEVEIREHVDTLNALPEGQNNTVRYLLWKKIEAIFPETKNGHWKLRTKGAKTRVIEVL